MPSIWKTLFDIHVMPYLRKEEGQGMIEYVLIVALIAVVVMAALIVLGPKIRDKFSVVGGQL